MNSVEKRTAAVKFAGDWQGKGYEKGDSQPFWLSLLSQVLGVDDPDKFIHFEEQVHLDHTSFIDGFIPDTHVLIEQKGLGKDLRKPIRQSDGTLLTPFQQAKRYAAELPYSARPRWIVTCNFAEFNVYDMEHPVGEPEVIELKNLGKEYYRLQFLVEGNNETIHREMEVSLQAGELVGMLYDKLIEQYRNPEDIESQRSLNMLCVRIVFCLYAEDAGLFGEKLAFHNYLARYHKCNCRQALMSLFKTLDTKPEERDPYIDEALAAFPYVNGGLFSDETVVIPRLNDDIVDLLLEKASVGFDWSNISPTIFGAVFESTLNPETRRSGGMHYTSIENIHKVIDSLFLDNLKEELRQIREIKVKRTFTTALEKFQTKLSNLNFLDPACGSGNFLTESYLSLRRLENEVLRELHEDRLPTFGGDYSRIRVSIKQFYGIEINDFAVSVAKTALWIAESRMMKETEDIEQKALDFLPLKTYTNIHEGDALDMDWETVVPKTQLDYIMGNPPFVGARLMGDSQKEGLVKVFGKDWKNVGNLDFVCAWYKKAADLMRGTPVETAFVSTSSICQGEQVAAFWKPLYESGFRINFAYRTFRWDSEAKMKAHVHCIIVGFSEGDTKTTKKIFSESTYKEVGNINAYLLDAPDVFIDSRSKPLCDVPEIGIGNKPIDDGNYLFTEEERDDFIRKEPQSAKWFRPFYGAVEVIRQRSRYCLPLFKGHCLQQFSLAGSNGRAKEEDSDNGAGCDRGSCTLSAALPC